MAGESDAPKAELKRALSEALGIKVLRLAPVSGGDINDSYKAETASGALVFVKTNARAPVGLFTAEAAGLHWLAESRAIKVPEVLAVSEASAGTPAFLALAYEASRPATPNFSQRLGHQLAALHGAGAPNFGWTQDNFIATLPQANPAGTSQTWAAFYRDHRLRPQLQRALKTGRLNSPLVDKFEQLFEHLDDLVGPAEPPARLHGDLWAGNHMCNESGEPVVFDPAVYGGHREVDLAMMRLFGGYAEAVFQAYHEAFPLLPGHRERVALYQIYPLLVHVNLFQGGYVHQLEAAVRSALGNSGK